MKNAVACLLRPKARKFDLGAAELEWVKNLAQSQKCEGWTGADFKALFASAQILCIRRQTATMKQKGEKREPHHIVLKDFDEAVSELRPSLPSHERRRFDRIYKEFAGDRKDVQAETGEASERRQRVALR